MNRLEAVDFSRYTEELLEEIYGIVKERCEYYTSRYTGNAFGYRDKEDILQDTYLRVIRYLDSHDKNKSCLRTYISKIVHSTVVNFYAYRSRESDLIIYADSVELNYFTDPIDGDIGHIDLQDVIDRCGLTEVEANVLRYLVQELQAKEIARILGVTEQRISAVRKQIQRKISRYIY